MSSSDYGLAFRDRMVPELEDKLAGIERQFLCRNG